MTNVELVHLDVMDGLATISLDQPPVNALDRLLVGQLSEAIDLVRASDSVRAVLVTGGPNVFAAGGDVKEMLDWDYRSAVLRSSGLGDACTALARLPVPVVAEINGYALGGGCELALAADFRVCSTTSRLGFPEILLGVIPGAGGTQRLPRLVGAAKAKHMIMTGRALKPAEALSIGLVDRVAEPHDVHHEALKMCEPFLNGPALALAAAKQAVDRGMEVDLATGLEIERSLFAGMFATQDRATGMQSFLEHGPGKAQFDGR